MLNRGNERRAIFRDEHDYEGFLDRLGRCSQRFGLRVYAYALMGNHYHLVWRRGRFRLGQIAEHFGVGESTVSHACRRAEQRLQTDRKLQSQLKGLLQPSIPGDLDHQPAGHGYFCALRQPEL